MTRKLSPQPISTAEAIEPIDAAASLVEDGEAGDVGPVLVRPDGFYWQAPDGHAEFGPFQTYELALADRDALADEPQEGGEALREAEGDIGINEWIDAETGEPAEGQSPPHLEAN